MMVEAHDPIIKLNKYSEEICSYLGLASDSKTRYSYPTSQNYCHYVKPGQSVSHTHQEKVCLSSKHAQCPVYQAKGEISFPSELRGQGPPLSRSGRSSWLWVMGTIIVVAITFLLVWPGNLLSTSAILSLVASSPTATKEAYLPSPTQMDEKSSLSVPTPTPTLSPSPTTTPSPTVVPTATLTPGPAIGTPFGIQEQYVIYRVSLGDSMGELARTYGTSIEAIQISSNIQPGEEIWLDDLLVIPVNQSDPSQVIGFMPLYVDHTEYISDLAERYSVLVSEIRYYNNLGDEETIPANRWLIIPVRGE
ncbi:MAG: hypothetical protein MAG431_01061 [Chloroflexi bacterium]|nr:hypothetical protein [Chloroflexota bacterium]